MKNTESTGKHGSQEAANPTGEVKEMVTIDETMKKAMDEAEERGYLRGLNEAARQRMAEPGVWEMPVPEGGNPMESEATTDILRTQRRSIWD